MSDDIIVAIITGGAAISGGLIVYIIEWIRTSNSKKKADETLLGQLRYDDGVLYDKTNADARSLIINRDTFNEIFILLYKQSKEAGKNDDEIRKTIEDFGYKCGSRFGKEYKKNVLDVSSKKYPTAQDKINKWSEFDSSAGFGKITATTIGDTSVTVLINDTFQANKDYEICTFMKGYCAGCIKAIIAPSEFYEIKDTKCNKVCKELNNDTKCSFTVKLAVKRANN